MSSTVVALVVVAAVVGVLARYGRRIVDKGDDRRMELDEAHLHEIFQSSDEAAALVARDGSVVQANEAFLHLFGHGPEQVRKKGLTELLPPGPEGTPPIGAVRRAAQGDSVSFDAVARRADGAAIEVSVMVGPARVPDKRAAAFLIVRDDPRKALVENAFRRLEKALDTMQLGVTVTDLDGRIVYTNPADAAMHGWSAEELVGKDVRVLGPDDRARRLAPEEIAAMGTWRRESVNVRRDGSTFPVQLMSDVVRDPDGEAIGVVTTCEDITTRKKAERALRESEERYALAMRGANDGLWDWNLESGEVFYSSVWREMLGLDESEFPGTLEAWLERVHPEDRDQLQFDLAAHRADRSPRFQNEHRIRHADGSWIWVLARGIAERGPDGKPYRITGSLTDITERKGAEAQLAQDALYDTLTGLPNRAFLYDLLNRALARLARRSDYTFAVLFLDLDRFKQVNDTLGHAAGDDLLVEVARRLEESVRPGDVVTRLAGDEFCVLLDGIGESGDATRVARRILDVLDRPVRLGDRPVQTGCSIGIAISEPGMEDPEQILRNADTAMYRAKSEGRACFELFDRSMQEQAVELLRLENELRKAVEEGQFRLVYQPVVSLGDRTVTGLEALVRWHHPERGVLSPGSFVPLAEETGVIVPLGWWTLDEACSRMGDWARRHPTMNGMTVSVNLSARQLRHPELVDRVRGALDRAELEPRRLRLDVSEKVLMENPDLNRDVVARLRELGVQVQIDDFGTGMSSLSYLNRFHVSTLKLDRSFVREIDTTSDRSAVAQAFITLARALDIPVVAEGVESDVHDARLRDLRCEQGQGYLYHQPLDPDAVTTLLERELDEA